MKSYSIYFALVLAVTLGLAACGGQETNTASETPATATDPAVGSAATPVEAPQAGGTVFHYTCPQGHEGGSNAQGKCSVCGGDLVHNQAFHAQQPQGSDPGNAITVNPTNGTPATPPPAQNAAGVYHYTCPQGHAGGSGAQGNCAQCGTALVHNQAYHQ